MMHLSKHTCLYTSHVYANVCIDACMYNACGSSRHKPCVPHFGFHRGGGGVKEFVGCCFPYECYAGNVLARKVAAVPASWLLWHKELEEASFVVRSWILGFLWLLCYPPLFYCCFASKLGESALASCPLFSCCYFLRSDRLHTEWRGIGCLTKICTHTHTETLCIYIYTVCFYMCIYTYIRMYVGIYWQMPLLYEFTYSKPKDNLTKTPPLW